MNAAELRRRHFPVFELRAVEAFAQTAQHQGVVEFFLLGESGDVDGLEARQRLASVFEIVGNGLVGKIARAGRYNGRRQPGWRARAEVRSVYSHSSASRRLSSARRASRRLFRGVGKKGTTELTAKRKRESRAMFARGRPRQNGIGRIRRPKISEKRETVGRLRDVACQQAWSRRGSRLGVHARRRCANCCKIPVPLQVTGRAITKVRGLPAKSALNAIYSCSYREDARMDRSTFPLRLDRVNRLLSDSSQDDAILCG